MRNHWSIYPHFTAVGRQWYREDVRSYQGRLEPNNKLSDEERQAILDICNSPESASCPPNLIVPSLADQGIYIASEAKFYRVLKEHNQLSNRSRTKAKGSHKRPLAQKATAPNQVWSWDISYLPSVTKGKHYYLYMITDILAENSGLGSIWSGARGHAAELLQRAVWNEKCVTSQVVLHSDNGAPMRSFTLLAKMQDLGVISSYSRPRVSNEITRTLSRCSKPSSSTSHCLLTAFTQSMMQGGGLRNLLIGTTTSTNTAVLSMLRLNKDILVKI